MGGTDCAERGESGAGGRTMSDGLGGMVCSEDDGELGSGHRSLVMHL